MLCLALASSPLPCAAPRGRVLMGEVRVRFPGGREALVPPGSPLSLAAYRAGAQVSYQCKAGVCGSCEVVMGGKAVRACQATVAKPWFGDTVTVASKSGSPTKL